MVNLFLTSTGDFVQQDLIWWLGSMIHVVLGQAIFQFSRANSPLVAGECNPKTNMDTQNDGLEQVAPLKYGHFWYLC